MFNIIKTYKKYIQELIILSFPMIIGNLGIILIGAGSVFVAAKHSTDTLIAISIANAILSCIIVSGIGLLASISPLLSNFRGAKIEIEKYFLPTIFFAMALAALSAIAVLISVPLVGRMGFSPKIMPVIKQFMIISAFSTFGGYLYAALKEYLQAFEIVFFPNFIAVFSVLLNIYLSFVYVFGWYGSPAMGAVGIAVANLMVRTLEGLLLLLYCLAFTRLKVYWEQKYFLNLIKIGLPIAMAILFEFLAFNIVTIIMGEISGLYAASQNILLTITNATFMIPIAISSAIAVKVGFANGEKNFVDVKRYAYSGILICVGFMALCALNFILSPKFFVNIFTQDTKIVAICVPIMVIAGIFQIFDGMQVALGGIFKGLKKTKTVMLGDLAAYWGIGLPLGALLAFKLHMNLYGFWVGLAISLFTLSMILLFILIRYFKRYKNVTKN